MEKISYKIDDFSDGKDNFFNTVLEIGAEYPDSDVSERTVIYIEVTGRINGGNSTKIVLNSVDSSSAREIGMRFLDLGAEMGRREAEAKVNVQV